MLKTHSDCIVVVDDCEYIPDMMKGLLDAVGFTNIITFTNSAEALKAMECPISPAVVIADLNMPDYTGLELLRRVEKIHPLIDGILIAGQPIYECEVPAKYTVFTKSPWSIDLLLEYLNLLIARNNG